MILKNVLDKIKGSTENIELSNDTVITLSQIESGCLIIPYEERAVMILKCGEEEAQDLSGLNSLSISTELIERPEFPTIAAYIKLTTKNTKLYDYEYFFNVESSEEMELFEKISKQSNIEIILYDDSNMILKRLELNQTDRSLMTSMLEKAGQLFDKT